MAPEQASPNDGQELVDKYPNYPGLQVVELWGVLCAIFQGSPVGLSPSCPLGKLLTAMCYTALFPFLSHFPGPFLCFLQINYLHSNPCSWPNSGEPNIRQRSCWTGLSPPLQSCCAPQIGFHPHCSSLCFLNLLGLLFVHFPSSVPHQLCF